MFLEKKTNVMPGYTGHTKEQFEDVGSDTFHEVRSQIPGYGGYIPAVKSENLFGKTYGNVTYKSAAKEFNRGIDAPPPEKYKSIGMEEFKDQAQVNGATAAKSVGVVKLDDTYVKPIDPQMVNKFWGINDTEMDELVQQKHLERNTNQFYGVNPNEKIVKDRTKPQTEEEAMNQFFAVEEKPELKLGEPIPGYSGVSRRVGADNVFGMTYAEARVRARESLSKINNEKGETLKMNSKFIPAYDRPKDEEEWFE